MDGRDGDPIVTRGIPRPTHLHGRLPVAGNRERCGRTAKRVAKARKVLAEVAVADPAANRTSAEALRAAARSCTAPSGATPGQQAAFALTTAEQLREAARLDTHFVPLNALHLEGDERARGKRTGGDERRLLMWRENQRVWAGHKRGWQMVVGGRTVEWGGCVGVSAT